MSRLWNLLLALIVLAAFILQIGLLLAGGQDINAAQASTAVPLSTRFVRFFSYFTVESNLLVLFSAASLAWNPQQDGRLWRVLRLDALLGIAVTGIVFATVLSGLVHHSGIGTWVNAGFHYLSPLLALLGWCLFGPRPRIDGRTLVLAFVWPVAWLAYTLIRGALTAWYPYPFLNANELGYARVALNIAIILAGASAFALLLWGMEKYFPNGRQRAVTGA
ncbi:hypothetical protein SAMN06296058_0531 [Pseudoxanthomonas indica]|uniref:FAR-17a/AIG1-like protein n=2 Tax=Pseudoxanthomonas indica TaxID=428993 RepID=A0A1T5J5C8_9GAMM|nr:hypothetical protein SAMN06296058_0531 [Pseudoxanthomonas indica]